MNQYPGKQFADMQEEEASEAYASLTQRTQNLLAKSAATEILSGELLTSLNTRAQPTPNTAHDPDLNAFFDFQYDAMLQPSPTNDLPAEPMQPAYQQEPYNVPAEPMQPTFQQGQDEPPSGPKTYPCTVEGCAHTFSHAGSRSNHIRSLHNHEFDCPACANYSVTAPFATMGAMERHLWKKHQEWFSVCRLCEKAFANPDRFAAHVSSAKHMDRVSSLAVQAQAASMGYGY